MALITLRDVTKRYRDGTVAVDAVSLDVADGELVVLVGPSGCGKTTLLNMVAGLEDITDGTIAIDGQVINDLAPGERNIAMVFQSYALYPHMTVRGNMAFPLELAGMNADAIRTRVEETAAMLGLNEHLDRRPAHLSGGQRQRVAMGRAIVRRPRAFLLDEPLSNLDPLLRVHMRRQVANIQRTLGITTLYVTHDQTEAMTLGDRVVVMRGGIVQQVGTPQTLYDSPHNLFVAGFIGSPSMNFVPAVIDDGLMHSPLGTLPIQGRNVNSHAVILGIRPEDFRIANDAHHAGRIDVDVTAVETLGSDTYAYFAPRRDSARSTRFDDVLQHARDADSGLGEAEAGAGNTLIARLSATTAVRPGHTLTLRYDATSLHIFNAASGVRSS